MVGSSVAMNYVVHSYILLPRNQVAIDINHQICHCGWSYQGPVTASQARMDLNILLHEVLQLNDSIGFRYHHVHLEIMVNELFDYEAPKARKVANESRRQNRASSVMRNNKRANGESTSSNDASWCTETSSIATGDLAFSDFGGGGPTPGQQVNFFPAAPPRAPLFPSVFGGPTAMDQAFMMHPQGYSVPVHPSGSFYNNNNSSGVGDHMHRLGYTPSAGHCFLGDSYEY